MSNRPIDPKPPISKVLDYYGYQSTGKNRYQCLDKSGDGLTIHKNDTEFHDFKLSIGGDAINLIMAITNCNTGRAFQLGKEIMGIETTTTYAEYTPKKVEYKGAITTVVSAIMGVNEPRLREYLIGRGLGNQRVYGGLLEIKTETHLKDGSKKTHSYVGLGNEEGGYILRNKFMTRNHGHGGMTVLNANSKTKYHLVFEGAMDYFAMVTLLGKNIPHKVTILNTTSHVSKLIKASDDKEYLLYLDNDFAGDIATAQILEKIEGSMDRRSGYDEFNDFNDKLLGKKNERQDVRYLGGFVYVDDGKRLWSGRKTIKEAKEIKRELDQKR